MLADDRTSSATVLFAVAETLLREARAAGAGHVRAAAAQVCDAQPSMGGLWNLAAAALDDDAALFERLAAQARRAPDAAARFACGLLRDVRRVVTCSRSAVVERCVRALGVPVICAESRPGLEGRALAAALAHDGLPVTVVADAAIASDLRSGDVVLVGADAVSARWFINKTGTLALCAAAEAQGVASYAVAGREKCVAEAIARRLTLRDDDPRTLWSDPAPGVAIANPLFERVPVERVAGIITDAGLLAGDMIAQACASVVPARAVRALHDLLP
jgi:translation initiation factor 2B subunit (eIF-2B alpha/beta/delta family)